MIGLILSAVAVIIYTFNLIRLKRLWEGFIFMTFGLGLIYLGIIESTYSIEISVFLFIVYLLIEFKEYILWLFDKVLGTDMVTARRKYE